MRKRKDGYRNGRVTNKAVDIWAGFGKKKSGWKPKVYRAGEWMVDRLDFEKLTLIDLSLSPSVGVFKSKSPVSESIKAPIIGSFGAKRYIYPIFPFSTALGVHGRSVIAYKSLQYLQSLLDDDLIVPEESESLNEVYKLHPSTTSSPSSNPSSISESEFSVSSSSSIPKTNPEREPQQTLLAPEAVPAIISHFESTTASADLYRAIEQSRLRFPSGRADF